jgi:predicted RNA methylase
MDLSHQTSTYREPQEAMAHLPNYFTWTYPGLGEHISGVVELGCGTGLAIPHCAERADVIYAVDRDPEVLGDVSKFREYC